MVKGVFYLVRERLHDQMREALQPIFLSNSNAIVDALVVREVARVDDHTFTMVRRNLRMLEHFLLNSLHTERSKR